MTRRILWVLFVLITALMPVWAYGQGVQTGAVTGTVTSSDNAVLSDANIFVSSPALQGVHTTTTDVNGVFVAVNLPPGRYTIKISKAGFNAAERSALVPLGGTATVDAILAVASVVETVVVEGVVPTPVTEIQTSANILASDINVMPLGRTPYLVAELMPGVTTNTPVAGQVTISGGFGYDNVF